MLCATVSGWRPLKRGPVTDAVASLECPRAIAPSNACELSFLAMVADFDANDARNAEFYAPAKANFATYVQGLLDEERGIQLSAHAVPCTHRWLVAPDGAILGAVRVRHHIDTPFFAENGGHIGYDVAPRYRGRGLGHLTLRVALSEAANLGLQRVLVLTTEKNVASRCIVVRQGGQLESISYSNFWGERLCRYWIEVAQRV